MRVDAGRGPRDGAAGGGVMDHMILCDVCGGEMGDCDCAMGTDHYDGVLCVDCADDVLDGASHDSD